MEPFQSFAGIAAPLLRANIDTDCIIPANKVLRLEKSGYSDSLFSEWRFKPGPGGEIVENPDFILNREPYRKAQILLAGANFGCGSSREPAVWALYDFGFRCVIAPSFGEIFYSNCMKNGLLAVRLELNSVSELADVVEASEGQCKITVDLDNCVVTAPETETFEFSVADNYRTALLQGLDPIKSTLSFLNEIQAFETLDRRERPWLYAPLNGEKAGQW